MSFESQPQENTEGNIDRALKVRVGNEIQLELAKQNSLPDEGEEGMGRWMIEHAEAFRSLFEEAVLQNPKLLEEWDERQDKILEFFQSQLNELEDYNKRQAA